MVENNFNCNLPKNENQKKNDNILQKKYNELMEYNDNWTKIQEDIVKNNDCKIEYLFSILNLINKSFEECIQFNEFLNFSLLGIYKKERNLNKFKIIHFHINENFDNLKILIRKIETNEEIVIKKTMNLILSNNKNFLNNFKIKKTQIPLINSELELVTSGTKIETKKFLINNKEIKTKKSNNILIFSISTIFFILLSTFILCYWFYFKDKNYK